jgi:hypothetical protein
MGWEHPAPTNSNRYEIDRNFQKDNPNISGTAGGKR